MNFLDKLYRAWEEYNNKGCAEVEGEGLFLESGKDLIEEQRGWADEDPGKNVEFDPDACYLCTDNGEDPIWIKDFNDLLEIERISLDFSIDGRDICLGDTKDTCTLEELYEAREKIKAEIEDWKGENLDAENNTYSGQVNVGCGKVIAFEMAAEPKEDKLFFDDMIYLKRVR